MIHGNDNLDPSRFGPAQSSNGPGGGFSMNRVLSEVAIKAGQDTKAAATQATVNAIKKLANQKTPGSATIPNVAPASAASGSLTAKFKALPAWMRWTALGLGVIVAVKLVSPGRD